MFIFVRPGSTIQPVVNSHARHAPVVGALLNAARPDVFFECTHDRIINQQKVFDKPYFIK